MTVVIKALILTFGLTLVLTLVKTTVLRTGYCSRSSFRVSSCINGLDNSVLLVVAAICFTTYSDDQWLISTVHTFYLSVSQRCLHSLCLRSRLRPPFILLNAFYDLLWQKCIVLKRAQRSAPAQYLLPRPLNLLGPISNFLC